MKTYPMLTLVVTAMMLLSSCKKDDMIRGGGSTGNRKLALPAFHSVETHYDIGARITYGNTQEVTATGYQNLLNILDFSVENQVLKLKFNRQYNTIRNNNVIAHITLPAIQSAAIHGSNQIEISGFAVPELRSRIHGSGAIRIKSSTAEKVKIDIHGSGNVDADELTSQEAQVMVHGSGNTWITATNRLEATIQGSGNVYYSGNPQAQIQINGSGRVVKR